jgi:hypothetical protein
MDSQVDSQNLTSLLFGMDKGFFFLKGDINLETFIVVKLQYYKNIHYFSGTGCLSMTLNMTAQLNTIITDNKAGQRSFIVTLPTIGFIYHVWVTVTGGRKNSFEDIDTKRYIKLPDVPYNLSFKLLCMDSQVDSQNLTSLLSQSLREGSGC